MYQQAVLSEFRVPTRVGDSRILRNREDLRRALTRVLDIVLSLVLLAVLAPFLLLTAIGVYLTNPGPVFFGHMRLGMNGQQFRCWKFRSMVVDADQRLAELLATDPEARREWELDHKLRNDPRITKVGALLRKSSIDELPQLYNVLKGEMSLVGPRPIVLSEVERYRRYYAQYCSHRPGITGLWQISGRNDVSYRRRVALDVMYCRRKSVRFNLMILALTVPRVVFARGSY